MHDADFVFNSLTLLLVLGLGELECKELAISNALAPEDARETAHALLADDFVVLGRVLLLDVRGVLDASSDLTAVFQCLLGLVELAEDDFEKCAGVLADLFLVKDAHLKLE